jgi:hypothetical protein
MAKAIPTPHYAKVFCARKNTAYFSLSGTKNLRLQPERCATVLQLVEKIIMDIMKCIFH